MTRIRIIALACVILAAVLVALLPPGPVGMLIAAVAGFGAGVALGVAL